MKKIMENTNNFIIIIPAHAGSVRLPNKPLTMIQGKSLISRVFELAKRSNASAIYIATDSEKINDHAKSFGADVIMTSSNHKSGMDRIAEAGKILNLDKYIITGTKYLVFPCQKI